MWVKAEEFEIVNKLIPAILLELATHLAQAGHPGRAEGAAGLAAVLESYECDSTTYDHELGRLLGNVGGYGGLDVHRLISGQSGPDRYSEALDVWKRVPSAHETFRWPIPDLLGALRGVDDLDRILELIHDFADRNGGYPDFRVAVPASPDDFATRRFSARLEGRNDRVFIMAVASGHLVWRVYADEQGREPLGMIATRACNGLRAAQPEGDRLFLVLEGAIGQPATGDEPELSEVRDETTPCSEADFSLLREMVRQYVTPQYADGHIGEGEAWKRAVTMPACMRGVQVTSSDLRRALLAEGWHLDDAVRRYWYRSVA